MAGMSKEEKAAEMQRRKEERKQVRAGFFFPYCNHACTDTDVITLFVVRSVSPLSRRKRLLVQSKE
jgi:hypothetical protein